MRRILALLPIVVASAAVSAQEVPVVPAGAGGRFQTAYDRKATVQGFSASQLATFRSAVDKFAAAATASPQVREPSDPLCMRASTWFTVNPTAVLSGNFSLLRPLTFNGKCSKMTGGGVEVDFNMASFQRTKLTEDEIGDAEWFTVQADDIGQSGFKMESNGDLYEVYALNGRPLLMPVSIERYLQARIERSALSEESTSDAAFTLADYDRWKATEFPKLVAEARSDARKLAALTTDPAQKQAFLDAAELSIKAQDDGQHNRIASTAEYNASRNQVLSVTGATGRRFAEELAALSPAQRNLPACAADDGSFEARADCPTRMTLFELNDAYFDKKRPSVVQLVVMSTPSHAYQGETETMRSERMAIWQGLTRSF